MTVDVHHSRETLSCVHGSLCYHFETTRRSAVVRVVDVLNEDTSVPGEAVDVPAPVQDAVEAEGYEVVV